MELSEFDEREADAFNGTGNTNGDSRTYITIGADADYSQNRTDGVDEVDGSHGMDDTFWADGSVKTPKRDGEESSIFGI